MLIPWNDTVLCTVKDITDIVGRFPDMVEVSDNAGSVAPIIQANIDAVKRKIRRKLMKELPGKYVNWPGVGSLEEIESGTTVTLLQSDTLLDRFSNPSELKDAAIAWTIAKLYRRAATHKRFDDGEANKQLLIDAKDWEAEGDASFADSLGLLVFDINQDYVTQDNERFNQRRVRFYRA